MGEMRIIGGRGDTKVIWNPENSHEVKAAERQFKDLVKKQKFAAFRVLKDGERGEQVREFDPRAAKLIIVPPMAGGAA
jgi:hypothetical protein